MVSTDIRSMAAETTSYPRWLVSSAICPRVIIAA
jgi:hypothetical protein